MATLRKRINSDGKTIYLIDFYSNGRRFVRSTKTGDFKTAQLILKEIEAKVARNAFKVEDITPKNAIFLKQFIEEFLNYSGTHKSYNTYQADKLSLKTLFRFVGDRSLPSIESRLLDQYANERVEKVKKSSVNVELRHLKAAFSKAVEWGYLQDNPFKAVKLFRLPEGQPSYLKRDELARLLKTIDQAWLKEIVLFAVNTGVRIGELVNIEWSDIDFRDRIIHIRHKKDFTTKSLRERAIPMNGEVFSLLNNLERDGTYIFPNSCGKKRDQVFVSRTFKKYLRKAELDNRLTFHSLRHTFASYLVQNGVSLYIVSKLLGHADVKTTMIYSHLSPQTFHEVMNQFSTKEPAQHKMEGIGLANSGTN